MVWGVYDTKVLLLEAGQPAQALAAEQARLTACRDAGSPSRRDIAWLTGRLALGEARMAAAAPPPEPRDPTA